MEKLVSKRERSRNEKIQKVCRKINCGFQVRAKHEAAPNLSPVFKRILPEPTTHSALHFHHLSFL